MLAKSVNLMDDFKGACLDRKQKEFTLAEQVKIMQDYESSDKGKKSVLYICRKYGCTCLSFYSWRKKMSYLEDCAKKKNKCDRLHDCSYCLELIRDAVEEFIAQNKEVSACARLVVTGGVLALKGTLARDALLRKHHCVPFLSEEEY